MVLVVDHDANNTSGGMRIDVNEIQLKIAQLMRRIVIRDALLSYFISLYEAKHKSDNL